ncbi:hypothetical protein BFJ63_vAg7359 [Fusarium oxysporum f. sp. narcissi]|uniref:Uncharacterized protein n=3 Tax=Fusarium oxysporum TaxID=5507 RepID=A0A420PCD5_FUSOX|nr:hypothetical protein BFJ65_g6557 [Fusarium oxysporum f. sp. cepae]RKK90125.1 hypothetical protein BFJ71_g11799 [Fusarium oxysporum]RYC89881.1 hypothetical protein BFJ63_vAg7359 [Fusarium oxysporum f. sp. narcissi]RKK50001.1 hypothetical protein BFJ67_g6639 [Fusarium oxysporum f. sp. cepae]RKK61499.1 hypothetical protein BFJ66_g1235 [Fusarium oxysporum f. sp. cepae]
MIFLPPLATAHSNSNAGTCGYLRRSSFVPLVVAPDSTYYYQAEVIHKN